MKDMKQVHNTREEWLTARLGGVGASEVSAILGLSRFASPWSVWQQKVDGVVDLGHPSPEAEAGHRLEPVIAQWFSDICEDSSLPAGFAIQDSGDYAMYWAEEVGLPLFATPDRLLVNRSGGFAVLELKAAWYDQAKRFRREFPMEYRCQVQIQMPCTGVKLAYYAVLLNGMELVWFKEEYNEKFVTAAVKKVEQFWGYVESRTPPPEDFSEATSQAIAAHYDSPVEATVELPQEFDTYASSRRSLTAKIKELERQKKGIENKIKGALGNNTVGVLPDGTEWSWKPDKRGVRTLRTTKRSDDE